MIFSTVSSSISLSVPTACGKMEPLYSEGQCIPKAPDTGNLERSEMQLTVPLADFAPYYSTKRIPPHLSEQLQLVPIERCCIESTSRQA